MIPGGYYIKARKLMENEIANKPPVVRELWDWLLMNAFHTDNGGIKRGQQIRTMKEVQDALSWRVGYAKKTYSIKQLRSAYDFLMKGNMVVTTKVTSGTLITICNYNKYQDPKNYEGHNEGHTKGRGGANLYKEEDKEYKNKKEKNNTKKEKVEKPEDVTAEVWIDFVAHRKEKKAPITKTALRGISKEASKAGWTLQEALEETCQRGWRSFKSDWVDKKINDGGLFEYRSQQQKEDEINEYI